MDACLQKFETSMGSSPTKTSSTEGVASPPRRVAHWDSKREKCANCDLIYLKTLSQHLGFCSVDCKSNMNYLQKVDHTIRAMKVVVDEQQRQQEQAPRQELQQVEVAQKAVLPNIVARSVNESQSFADFGVDVRAAAAFNVEWAFSAMY